MGDQHDARRHDHDGIGWVGTHRKTEAAPAPAPTTSLPSGQVEPTYEDESEYAQVKPEKPMAPPPFGNPVAASFAGRQPGVLVAAEQLKAGPTTNDGLFASSRKREEELARNARA